MRPPRRVVSLVPSLTETLFDLGLDREVVGVTRYCVHPEGAMEGGARLGGTKNPDLEKLAALRPDLVLVNTEENRAEDVAWLRERFEVLETFPRTVEEAACAIAEVGRAVGRAEEGAGWQAMVEAEVARTEAAALDGRRLRVFYPIWQRPWMSINRDTYIHDLLRLCGADNVTAGAPERYPTVDLDEVAALDPHACLLPDEPFPFGAEHVLDLQAQPSFRHRMVIPVDGRAFSWHGTGSLAGLRVAAAVVEGLRSVEGGGAP